MRYGHSARDAGPACRPQRIDYCSAQIAYSKVEEFHILFLDRKNALIKDERQQRGTIDHTPVYTREVIKRTLELGGSALILVHNHPSGDPAPSAVDIAVTQDIIKAAAPLGIVVHDHLIIGRGGHISLRDLGSSDPRPKVPGLIRVCPSSPDQPPFMTTILKLKDEVLVVGRRSDRVCGNVRKARHPRLDLWTGADHVG